MHPKGSQSWIFTRRTDAEAESLILWPPDAKNWLIGKDPDVGKDWRQEEKGTTGDEMVGWHHWLDGHEFEPAPGVGDGQGSLVCCSPWGRRVRHDWATRLNWTITYFGIQIVSDFTSGALSGWYLCPFDLFPSLFEYVLLFGTRRCSWLILFFLCSRPDLHGALVSFIGEWNLETRSKC